MILKELSNLIKPPKRIEPLEYIYVATNDSYRHKNKFKLGGVSSFENLKNRQPKYNTGRSKTDDNYFVYIRKVSSYRSVEHSISNLLGGFKETASKELYIIHFDWLTKCLEMVIDHSDEFTVFVNENREQMVRDTTTKTPVDVQPVQVQRLRMIIQNVGEEPKQLLEVFDPEVIEAMEKAFENFQPNNGLIDRKSFEERMLELSPKKLKKLKQKRKLWELVRTGIKSRMEI